MSSVPLLYPDPVQWKNHGKITSRLIYHMNLLEIRWKFSETSVTLNPGGHQKLQNLYHHRGEASWEITLEACYSYAAMLVPRNM